MSDFIDSSPFLWESDEFICFILVFGIHVYNNIRDNKPILTRRAILQPRLDPWERLLNFGEDGSFLTMGYDWFYAASVIVTGKTAKKEV
jgi:hypothetical protein